MKDILSNRIDEHVDFHKETLDLLSRPEWVEAIARGKSEVANDVEGKPLAELAD